MIQETLLKITETIPFLGLVFIGVCLLATLATGMQALYKGGFYWEYFKRWWKHGY